MQLSILLFNASWIFLLGYIAFQTRHLFVVDWWHRNSTILKGDKICVTDSNGNTGTYKVTKTSDDFEFSSMGEGYVRY